MATARRVNKRHLSLKRMGLAKAQQFLQRARVEGIDAARAQYFGGGGGAGGPRDMTSHGLLPSTYKPMALRP